MKSAQTQKLLPEEPTTEMMAAGIEAWNTHDDSEEDVQAISQAMYDAAPAADNEPRYWEYRVWEFGEWSDWRLIKDTDERLTNPLSWKQFIGHLECYEKHELRALHFHAQPAQENAARAVTLYECADCGAIYQTKVTRCDCMPEFQKYNRWTARRESAALES